MNKELKKDWEFVKRTWDVPIILALMFATFMATIGRMTGMMLLQSQVASFWMVWIPAFVSVIGLWIMIIIAGLAGSWLRPYIGID